MSIDAHASFGYGLKISDKELISKINEEDIDFGKDFEVAFSGDTCGDDMGVFLFIKKSEKSIYTWENNGVKCLKPINFIVQDDWDLKLSSFIKEHNLKNPKIGWWLLASMG